MTRSSKLTRKTYRVQTVEDAKFIGSEYLMSIELNNVIEF